MNKPGKELKRIARQNLCGHFGIPMGVSLAATLLPLVLELPFSMLQDTHQMLSQTIVFYVANFLISLVTVILSAGVIRVHLSMARKQPYSFNMLFYGFSNHPDRYILTGLLMVLITIPTVIPMIAGMFLMFFKGFTLYNIIIFSVLTIISIVLLVIVELQYALSLYLVIDHSQMRPTEALEVSHGIMKGHRGRLFYLILSFVGLHLLSALTLWVGYLWVAPYQAQTMANFYLDVIGETTICSEPYVKTDVSV